MSADLRSTLDRAAAEADTGVPDMAAIRGRGRQRTLRRRVAVGVVTLPVLVTGMFLLAPGRSDEVTQQPVPPADSAPSVRTPTVRATPGGAAGRVLAYVDKVTSQEIVYDQARWIDGCLDGFAWLPDEESSGEQSSGETFYAVEQLCVRNDKPEAAVSPVAPDVVVISAAGAAPSAQQTITWLGEFGANTPDADHWVYWLTIDHGVVTKIEQVNPVLP